MSGVFGDLYSRIYDSLYSGKDYEGECDLIERVIREFADKPVQSLLDVGCGTGNHAVPMARRGYHVAGVDLSPTMIETAKAKAAALQPQPSFHVGDARSFDLGRRFDMAVMMFAVIGYLPGNDDVLAALRSIRRHLEPGALFAFDFWYGPTVLSEEPGQRIKTIPVEDGRVLRVVSTTMDPHEQRSSVEIELIHIAGDRVLAESKETHVVRFFFPREVELLLAAAGFAPLALRGFPDFGAPTIGNWNAIAVARAV